MLKILTFYNHLQMTVSRLASQFEHLNRPYHSFRGHSSEQGSRQTGQKLQCLCFYTFEFKFRVVHVDGHLDVVRRKRITEKCIEN